jgi:hypothetical protein
VIDFILLPLFKRDEGGFWQPFVKFGYLYLFTVLKHLFEVVGEGCKLLQLAIEFFFDFGRDLVGPFGQIITDSYTFPVSLSRMSRSRGMVVMAAFVFL